MTRRRNLDTYDPFFPMIIARMSKANSKRETIQFDSERAAMQYRFRFYDYRNALRAAVSEMEATTSKERDSYGRGTAIIRRSQQLVEVKPEHVDLRNAAEHVAVSIVPGHNGPRTALEFYNSLDVSFKAMQQLGLDREMANEAAQRLMRTQAEADAQRAAASPSATLPVDDGTLSDAELMALQYGATPPPQAAPAGVPAPPPQATPARVQSLDDDALDDAPDHEGDHEGDPMAEHEEAIRRYLEN
jgi:hypothetical protein